MIGIPMPELDNIVNTLDPLAAPIRLARYVAGLVGSYGGFLGRYPRMAARGFVGDRDLAALTCIITGDPSSFLLTGMTGLLGVGGHTVLQDIIDVDYPDPETIEVEAARPPSGGRA
jgi:hypothetical protein